MKPFNSCDDTTWPAELTRTQMAAIRQCSPSTIDRLVRFGLMRPMPMDRPGVPRWSKKAVQALHGKALAKVAV